MRECNPIPLLGKRATGAGESVGGRAPGDNLAPAERDASAKTGAMVDLHRQVPVHPEYGNAKIFDQFPSEA